MTDTGDYKYNKDNIIQDSTPFKALDGSYHASMEDVDKANERYWDTFKSLALSEAELDKPLSLQQLARINNDPNYRSLIRILHETVLSQEQSLDDETRRMGI